MNSLARTSSVGVSPGGNTDSCLNYPPNSPYANRPGYLGSLTEDQQAVLHELQQWILDNSINISDLAKFSVNPVLVLLRYLRANGFDIRRAQEHINENLRWRAENGVNDILDNDPEDILECTMSSLLTVYPHWHFGQDIHGRPVMYKLYHAFEVTRAKQLTSIEALVRYHIWEQEACMFLCREHAKRTGLIVETLTAVIDIKNMSLRQVNKDFLSVIKAIAEIDQRGYPETLGALYIINAPSLFPVVWRGVKPWIDPNTAAKFHILSRETDWRPVFEQNIGVDNMPRDYGGNGPALSELGHPYQTVLEVRAAEVEEGDRAESLPDEAPLIAREESIHSSQFFDAPGGLLIDDWQDELEYMRKYFGVKSEDPAQRYAAIASTIVRPPWLLRLPVIRRLSGKDMEQLTNVMVFAISLHALSSIANLAFGGYVLANMYWVAYMVQWQMWTSVLVVCLSAWLVVLNVAGFIAVKYKNRRLLLTYESVLVSFGIVFMLISIVCWAFAGGGDEMMNVSKSALKDELPSDVDIDVALQRMRVFNILLASGSLGCSVLALLPMCVASALCFQMRNDPRVLPEASQLRSVLLMTNCLHLVYAFVVIGYTAYALAYVLRHELDVAIGALYTSLLAGLAMVIVAIVGVWTSHTKYLAVTYLYTYLNLPLLIVCIVLSIQNFWVMDISDREIRRRFEDENEHANVEDIQAAVKGQLLVAGILCVTAVFMQLINANTARQLRDEMIRGQKRREEKSKSGAPYLKSDDQVIVVEASPLAKLTQADKLAMSWAIFTGLLHIFFTSTYVIFNEWLTRSPSSWVAAIWVLYGKLDSRYMHSDDFLVTIEALLALVVGPMLLVFAWGTFVHAPFRYSLAIISCTIQVYTQVLYYGTEIQSGFSHLLFANNAIFWILFVFMNLIRVVFPCMVLWHALRASSSRISVADMQVTIDDDASKSKDHDIEMIPLSSYSKTESSSTARRRLRRPRSERKTEHVMFFEETKGDQDHDNHFRNRSRGLDLVQDSEAAFATPVSSQLIGTARQL